MRNKYYPYQSLLAFFFICLFNWNLSAQDKISSSDWEKDLRFLQNTVHKDYSFLFKKTTAEQFDEKVEELSKAIPEMAEHEIVAGLVRIVSSFEYGHTAIHFRGGPIKYHQLPFNLYRFSDGVFIEGIHKDYKKALGAKVLKVEGVPIEEALVAIRPIVPAENDQFFKGYGLSYLGITEILHAQGVTKKLKNEVTFTLEREGKTFEQTITAVEPQHPPVHYGFSNPEGDWLSVRDQSQTPYYLKNLDKIYYYEYLPESKTVYVRYSQIQHDDSEDIPTFFNRVFDFIEKNEVEKLVLDVRLNGGGDNFNNKHVVTGIIQSEKINLPGKFFVIIGRRTFSACQNLINEFDNYTNAIFVGEPSGENVNFYGDNREVVLPNSKIPVRLSWAWWQDKPQWQNADWTAPHLAVDLSSKDYQTNQDPILKTALDFSADNFILDPMSYFTDLFQTGQIDLLVSEAERMIPDPVYRFFNFEGEFNRVGYDLMGRGQVATALSVFQLNSNLFPESANCYDSLAEAYWKSDNLEKAKELYKKAIELDPEGATGENARNMLERMEGK